MKFKILSLIAVLLLFSAFGKQSWSVSKQSDDAGRIDFRDDPTFVLGYLMEVDESPLQDESSNNLDGILKGAGEPNFVTNAPSGYAPGSYDFDGTDDFINAGNSSTDLIWADGEGMTLSIWAQHDDFGSGTNQDIYFRQGANNAEGYSFEWNDIADPYDMGPVFNPLTGYSAVLDTTAAFRTSILGEWHHYVGTCDGQWMKTLYMDGEVVDVSIQQEVAYAIDTEIINIGGRADSAADAMNGRLKQPGMWRRKFVDQEVRSLYRYGMDGKANHI